MSYRPCLTDSQEGYPLLDPLTLRHALVGWRNGPPRPSARGWRAPRLPDNPLDWRDGDPCVSDWDGPYALGDC
ncbi:MAG: hypothetical protein HQM01_08365 [Magnetococcales bacterium]|nr:hypothetical protein [Magnetococcales bacterium]